MRTNGTGSKLHKPAFFAFLMGLVLIGVLLGTVSYCYMSGDFLEKLSLSQTNFVARRQQMNYGEILIKSLSGTTVFLAAAFLLGFSSIGHPAEFAIPLIRGMGLGVTLAQMYSCFGKRGIIFALVLVLPGAAVSTAAVAVGVRESLGLSNIYMRISLSSKQEDGLLETLKLYGTKFLVLEAVLAVSAGIDCLCTVIFQRTGLF